MPFSPRAVFSFWSLLPGILVSLILLGLLPSPLTQYWALFICFVLEDEMLEDFIPQPRVGTSHLYHQQVTHILGNHMYCDFLGRAWVDCPSQACLPVTVEAPPGVAEKVIPHLGSWKKRVTWLEVGFSHALGTDISMGVLHGCYLWNILSWKEAHRTQRVNEFYKNPVCIRSSRKILTFTRHTRPFPKTKRLSY